ncbi:MAG TPA: hypothetical protein GX717_08925 [Clostridiaceae bacterium]|nr:hypothetical protein [Clostridiaceae bacterium]
MKCDKRGGSSHLVGQIRARLVLMYMNLNEGAPSSTTSPAYFIGMVSNSFTN